MFVCVLLTCGAVSSGELEREEGARGATLRAAGVCVGLEGAQGCTGLWLPSESLPWELGGVGGIWRDSRAVDNTQRGFIRLVYHLINIIRHYDRSESGVG